MDPNSGGGRALLAGIGVVAVVVGSGVITWQADLHPDGSGSPLPGAAFPASSPPVKPHAGNFSRPISSMAEINVGDCLNNVYVTVPNNLNPYFNVDIPHNPRPVIVGCNHPHEAQVYGQPDMQLDLSLKFGDPSGVPAQLADDCSTQASVNYPSLYEAMSGSISATSRLTAVLYDPSDQNVAYCFFEGYKPGTLIGAITPG
jgi:hypothetical protein